MRHRIAHLYWDLATIYSVAPGIVFLVFLWSLTWNDPVAIVMFLVGGSLVVGASIHSYIRDARDRDTRLAEALMEHLNARVREAHIRAIRERHQP